MWIFSKHGFFSVTVSPVDAGVFQLRAREERDLDALRAAVLALSVVRGKPERVTVWQGLELMVTPHTDYRYRFILDPCALGEAMSAWEQSVDYTNFKSAIARTPTQRHKEPALHEIWEIMLRFQYEEEQGDNDIDEENLTQRLFK